MRLPLVLLLFAITAAADDVRLGHAWEKLDRLERVLADKDAENEFLVDRLDEVGAARARLVPDPPPHDASDWQAREHRKKFEAGKRKFEEKAARAFLRALVLARPEGGVNQRLRVNIRAAHGLAAFPRGTSRAIRQACERTLMKERRYEVDGRLWDVIFATLVKRAERGCFTWMREEMIDATAPWPRTVAALRAVVRFERIAAGARRAMTKQLTFQFQAPERNAVPPRAPPSRAGPPTLRAKKLEKKKSRHVEFWNLAGPLVLAALKHFTTDPVSGKTARDRKTGGGLISVAEYHEWLVQHPLIGRSPWRDPPSWRRKRR